ncbi:hypothetical protein JCM10207_000429 [Rhodosporidiobolus poonsookiae]
MWSLLASLRDRAAPSEPRLPLDILYLVGQHAVEAVDPQGSKAYTSLARVSADWRLLVQRRRWRTLVLGGEPDLPSQLKALLRDPALGQRIQELVLERADQRGGPELQAQLFSFVLPSTRLAKLSADLQLKTGPLVLRALQDPLGPARNLVCLDLDCGAQTSRLALPELLEAVAALAHLEELSICLRPVCFDSSATSSASPPCSPRRLRRLDLRFFALDSPPPPYVSPAHQLFLTLFPAYFDLSSIPTLHLHLPHLSPPYSDLLPLFLSLVGLHLAVSAKPDTFLPALLPTLASLSSLRTLTLQAATPDSLPPPPLALHTPLSAVLRALPPALEHVFLDVTFSVEALEEADVRAALRSRLCEGSALGQVDLFVFGRMREAAGAWPVTLVRGEVDGRRAWFQMRPPDPTPHVFLVALRAEDVEQARATGHIDF